LLTWTDCFGYALIPTVLRPRDSVERFSEQLVLLFRLSAVDNIVIAVLIADGGDAELLLVGQVERRGHLILDRPLGGTGGSARGILVAYWRREVIGRRGGLDLGGGPVHRWGLWRRGLGLDASSLGRPGVDEVRRRTSGG
jgi:hypothetical protein